MGKRFAGFLTVRRVAKDPPVDILTCATGKLVRRLVGKITRGICTLLLEMVPRADDSSLPFRFRFHLRLSFLFGRGNLELTLIRPFSWRGSKMDFSSYPQILSF